MELFTQQTDSLLNRTPRIVSLVLSHLKTLLLSNVVSKRKILSSFYNPDDGQLFGEIWTKSAELRLCEAKEEINKGEYLPSKESDIRILSQGILDFFEELSAPALSENTLLQFGNVQKTSHEPTIHVTKGVGCDLMSASKQE
jgi:hypothetical protein